MIRINLLPTPKPKKSHRSGPLITTALPSLGMVALLCLVLAGGGLYGLYWRAQRQHEKTQTELKATDKRLASLAGVKTAYLQKQKDADALKHKFAVVDQLRKNQGGPVLLLTTVAETVAATDAVWLKKMSDEGTSISMDGMALSTTAVANLVTNLKKSGYFKTIELKETAQETDVKDYQAFSFTLTCEKQPQQPQPQQQQQQQQKHS